MEQPTFFLNEMVTVQTEQNSVLGVVRDWIKSPTGESWGYTVELSDGRTLEVPQDNMKATGDYEGPFRQYEVVEIYPLDFETDPSVAELVGQRGIITSLAANSLTNKWDVYVVVQSGETWFFDDDELRGTGIVYRPRELSEMITTSTVRVHVDLMTGEGTVIDGVPAENRTNLVPLQVDLNSLK